MREPAGTEFWRELKPIEHVFRPGALPEIYRAKVAQADERWFLPLSPTVGSMPLWISPSATCGRMC